MKTITVKTRPESYAIRVGDGVLDHLPRLLAAEFGKQRRCVVVTDSYLKRSLAHRAETAMRGAGWTVDSYALPRGEAAKSFAALERLYGFLLRRKIERRTPLIAVGGGTVGDAAGFAAATFYRGVPLVHVPTTLLAQVDSAIGGKTAVNHALSKNAVGAFYQPRLVVCDTSVLKSLPRRDFLSGLGEVVKYSLVFDPAFAKRLRIEWLRVLQKEKSALDWVVARCAQLKADVVAADTRDLSGRRELLNFGHTLGHALEAASGYGKVRHGEAVAWGMRGAVALSKGRGWLKDSALLDDLLGLLPKVQVPNGISRKQLLAPLARDKKAIGGRNVFVLLKKLGRPVRVDDVSRAEIEAALDVVEACS